MHLYTRCLAGPADNTFCYFHERVARGTSSPRRAAGQERAPSQPVAVSLLDDRPPAPGEALRDGLISDEPELAFWDALPTAPRRKHAPPTARIGQLAVVARRRGTDWFVGVLHSGAAPRTYELPLGLPARGPHRQGHRVCR